MLKPEFWDHASCRRCITLAASLLLVGLCMPTSAWAQSLPSQNSGAGAALYQQNPGLLTPTPPAASSAKDLNREVPDEEIHLEMPTPSARARQVQTGSPRLPIRQIRVEGVTLIKPEEVRRIVVPYEGLQETLSELDGIVEALDKLYHDRGFLTAQSYIPPQELEDGVLVIRVREGSVGQVSIEGNRFYRASAIRRNLSVKAGEPLDFHTLEADLNRSNRLNNFKLRAKLSAGQGPGQTDVRLQAAERQPLQITPTFDNQGRPFIGMYRTGLEIRDDSVTGWGDRFYGRLLSSSGTKIGMGSYSFPLNRFGTELSANAAYSGVDVQLKVKDPPTITGTAFSYGLGLSQPLNRSRSLVADVGVNWRSIKTLFDGGETGNTQIRSFDVGLTLDKSDRFGRTYDHLQSTVGVGTLGANTRFWKVENYLTRLVVLPKNNLLILRAHGQFTPDTLPAAEQFQIGGAYSVRGYTEGLLIGDRGVDFSAEWRFPIPGLRLVSPWLSSRLQGAVFYDYGRVWQDTSNPLYVSHVTNKTANTMLSCAGVGLRAQLGRYAQGFIDFGFGRVDRDVIEPNSQPTARIHFGIRSDLLPDNYRMRVKNPTPVVMSGISPAISQNPQGSLIH